MAGFVEIRTFVDYSASGSGSSIPPPGKSARRRIFSSACSAQRRAAAPSVSLSATSRSATPTGISPPVRSFWLRPRIGWNGIGRWRSVARRQLRHIADALFYSAANSATVRQPSHRQVISGHVPPPLVVRQNAAWPGAVATHHRTNRRSFRKLLPGRSPKSAGYQSQQQESTIDGHSVLLSLRRVQVAGSVGADPARLLKHARRRAI